MLGLGRLHPREYRAPPGRGWWVSAGRPPTMDSTVPISRTGGPTPRHHLPGCTRSSLPLVPVTPTTVSDPRAARRARGDHRYGRTGVGNEDLRASRSSGRSTLAPRHADHSPQIVTVHPHAADRRRSPGSVRTWHDVRDLDRQGSGAVGPARLPRSGDLQPARRASFGGRPPDRHPPTLAGVPGRAAMDGCGPGPFGHTMAAAIRREESPAAAPRTRRSSRTREPPPHRRR